jgi:hypothetical protein
VLFAAFDFETTSPEPETTVVQVACVIEDESGTEKRADSVLCYAREIPKGATGKLQRIGLAQKLGLG